MLNYEDYQKYLVENISENLWEYNIEEVTLKHVTKNNGVELDGLVIKEEGNNIAPNIYLEGYYADYLKHGDEERALADIAKAYKNVRIPESIDADKLTDRDYVLDNAYLTVVNYEKNYKELKDVPHKRVNDLALTVRCMVEQHNEGISSYRINNANLAMLDITPAQLFERAQENTLELFPPTLRSTIDVIEELSGAPLPEEMHEMPEIYVLSNTYSTNGATYMAYPDIIKEKLQEVGVTNAYILPSSVHEVIIIPDDGCGDKDVYNDMVKTINRTELDAKDILSDNVYYISENEKEITQLTGLNQPEKDMERGM